MAQRQVLKTLLSLGGQRRRRASDPGCNCRAYTGWSLCRLVLKLPYDQEQRQNKILIMCTCINGTHSTFEEEEQSHGYSQAFEKPGQVQATWPPRLSFVSPNPVAIQYLPINITWASGRT